MKTLVVLLISALLVADEFLRLSSPAPDEVKKPAGVPAAANPPKARTRPAPLFTTARKERDFLTLFPKTTSSSVNALRDTVQFYDEDDMPTLYQVWDRGPRSGFLFVRGGQRTANLEFPWANPAGMVNNSNFRSFRFVEFGGPIEWWRNISNGQFHGFAAEYAPGTTFGEILTVTDPEGFDHTFEMRIRRKRDDGTWFVDSYRPFPTEASFDAALARRGFAPYEHDRGTVQTLNSNHQRNAFASTALMAKLPNVPAKTVIDMLETELFASAKDKLWRDERPIGAAAPVAVGFNIVPRNFLGAFIPVNTESCMRCHRDAGTVVNLDGDSRWRLRGMDGIFSFSIVDLSTGQARLDPRLTKAGLLVHKKGMP